MTTIVRVRTDWVHRYHVQQDADAARLDCYVVQLPPYMEGVIWSSDSEVTMDELFQRCLRELDRLRAYPQPLYRPDEFKPFGVITARCIDDVCREREATTLGLVGGIEDGGHPDHAERVRALCRMWDVLDGAPFPATVPWPVTSIPH